MKLSKTIGCVIFDLDGTLVDSEEICNMAFLDLLPELRERASTEQLVNRNRGRKLAEIILDLEKNFGMALPSNFEESYRRRVKDLFCTELKPVPGVPEMLEAVNLPMCVASSGPPSKINHALKTCGLLSHFEGRIFSSYEVGSWKPDPGLFRFAMSSVGFFPDQCAVVEDSMVGIQAANAAGARAFYFTSESGARQNEDCIAFKTMEELPRLLDC